MTAPVPPSQQVANRRPPDLTVQFEACLGCGAPTDERICCDACWKRVPRDLPKWPYWRSRLQTARRINAWEWIEGIIVAVRTWLLDHPIGPVSGGSTPEPDSAPTDNAQSSDGVS